MQTNKKHPTSVHSIILIFVAVFIFSSCATKAVVVNPDGTFAPATVNIMPNDKVTWFQLTKTDSIVEIADPGALDPCDISNRLLAHRYDGNDLNEFTGPQRQQCPASFR